MDELCVQRRLVKSPPELWAEVSDLEALSRHLDLFGEIRISRLEPESTVAWEGDRASGTVVLDPAGWGTKVTLTAAMRVEPDPEVDGSAPAAQPQEEKTGDTTPVAAIEQAGGPAVETLPAPAPPRPEPSTAGRPGFFARLFRRRAVAVAPVAALPEPQPEPEVTPEPAPPPVAPEPVPAEPPAGRALNPEVAETALEHVLDTLGAAHHRPFSR